MRHHRVLTFVLALATTVPSVSAAQTGDPSGDVIELRRETMAAMWQRLDRLSALIADSAPGIGAGGAQILVQPEQMTPSDVYALVHGTEPSADARDIADLLDYVQTLWPPRSNVGWRGTTRAEPVIWVLPAVFDRYFRDTTRASRSLVEALSANDGAAAQHAVCRLSRACGRCHSIFRRVTHGDLKVEGNGWTGDYAACRDLPD